MNVMELAIESGLVYYGMGKDRAKFLHHLEAFAALVAAREREACAKVCEQPIDEIQVTDTISEVVYMDAHECAEAIRARGTT